jgi:Domain of unknown function (DUF4394)
MHSIAKQTPRAALLFCALLSACADSSLTTPSGSASSAAPTSGGPATSPSTSPGPLIYGLTAGNTLLTLDVQQANQVNSEVAITGLQAGERLIGIDFRPSDLNADAVNDVGKLYGVGSTSRVYLIDPQTGQVSAGMPLVTATGAAVTLAGTAFGVGFNPVPDRLRVHSNSDQNLRINVDNGVTAVDTALSYPADGADPGIVGTGYTNNDNDPATGTTLYAIDAARDILAIFNIPSGPNSGKMSVVGSLGINTSDAVGFDVAGAGNVAYAALSDSPSGKSTLYTIDLATGVATKLKLVAQSASPLIGIAVAP